MRNAKHLPIETIRTRYARVIRACRAAACLSSTEAAHAIAMHQIGDKWAGEAVNHFGGIPALFASAFRSDLRQFARKYGPAL